MKTIKDLDLTEYNSYRLKSTADLALFPEKEEDFLEIFQNFRSRQIIVLGGGNNIILSKKRYDDSNVFVICRKNLSFLTVNETQIVAGAGISLKELSEAALRHSLSGLEIFWNIPGTLGGSIWMNAGAYGEDIFSLLEEITFFDFSCGKFTTRHSKDIERSYRFSSFQLEHGTILKATLSLPRNNQEMIRSRMEEILLRRNANFPKNYPNAGSVFKRPSSGLSVGEMVEKLGLKGYKIGSAQISEKHGGFIINRSDASSDEILQLIQLIKESVYREFDVDLVVEQVII